MVDRTVVGGLVTRNGRIPIQSKEEEGGKKKEKIALLKKTNMDAIYDDKM